MMKELYRTPHGIYYFRFSLLGTRVHESTKTDNLRKAKALLHERRIQIVKVHMHKSTFPIKEIYEAYNKTYWLRFIHHGKIIHESTHTKDLTQAGEILKSRMSDLDTSINELSNSVPPDMTLSQAIAKAKDTYIPNLRGKKEVVYRLNIIKDLLGDIQLTSIKKAHFIKIREYLVIIKEVGASTINSYSANLNTLLKTARDEWGVKCSNVARVKLPVKRTNIRTISDFEDRYIRNWMASPAAVEGTMSLWTNQDLLEIYRLLMLSGMRRNELFSFKVNQIERNKINLHPEQHKTGDRKGNKSIVLNRTAQQLLVKRINRLQLKPSDIVFPYRAAQFSRLWKRMREGMNIPADIRFTPHCTRHTFASKLADLDVSIYKVSRLLGHTSVTTTEMYSHLFTNDLTESVDKLNDKDIDDIADTEDTLMVGSR